MYRSVLVPLDGSSFAEHALPFALSIARRASAQLQIVTVEQYSKMSVPISSRFSSHLTGHWSDYLKRIAELAGTHADVPICFRVLEGADVASAISAYAGQSGADLIVMSTHGRGALGRLWFGSVAYEIVQQLPVPMLFVKPGEGPIEWGKEPALRHMLVTLDGSSSAERIIEPAVALGTLMEASYTLLRVISSIPLGTPELDSISLSSQAVELVDQLHCFEERLRKESQDYLEGVAERLRGEGLKAQSQVTTASDAGTAILDELSTPTVDIVAMEIPICDQAFASDIGRVARKIIHGTTKPILLQSSVPAKQNGS